MDHRLEELNTLFVDTFDAILQVEEKNLKRVGDGNLSMEGIIKVITHPYIKTLPICLETPNDIEGYAREIAMLKQAVENL